MTLLLFTDLELVFETLLIQLFSMLPAFLAIWLLFYFLRGLFFSE